MLSTPRTRIFAISDIITQILHIVNPPIYMYNSHYGNKGTVRTIYKTIR